MTSPYFAKWISVEGEIKEEDYFKTEGHEEVLKRGSGKQRIAGSYDAKQYKVKLFLCSTDIQVSDKDVHIPYGVVSKIHDEADLKVAKAFKGLGLQEAFKVIGEISPEASWVKEGDKLSEDDIRYWVAGFPYGAYLSIEVFKEITSTKYVRIKGPCGHFH